MPIGTSEVAECRSAEIQVRYQDQAEVLPMSDAVTLNRSFECDRVLLESGPPPRRPNRNSPVQEVGDEQGWSELNDAALTAEEFQEVAEYLLRSGQASA